MPLKTIYRVTVVYSLSTQIVLHKQIQAIGLPQPISVRFTNSDTKGDRWEECVRWFWDKSDAEGFLLDLPTPKPEYNKPRMTAEEEKTLDERAAKADRLTQKLKRERKREKLMEQ